MSKFPARVHVILAREADYAIVIRRGPSRSVCTIGWDRKTDQFEIGQWLHGQIYHRLSDLSPDGRHFIYFAANGKDRGDVKDSWTAISKTPYLKAIGLWSGILWIGGGLFVTNTDYWLSINRGYCKDLIHELQSPAGLNEQSQARFDDSEPDSRNNYHLRLLRDGWKRHPLAEKATSNIRPAFRKPLPLGWFLEKTEHYSGGKQEGKSSHYDSHRLIHLDRNLTLDYPAWEWADLDRDRLVWTEAGILRAATIMKDGPDYVKDLHDFNEMSFKPLRAPYQKYINSGNPPADSPPPLPHPNLPPTVPQWFHGPFAP